MSIGTKIFLHCFSSYNPSKEAGISYCGLTKSQGRLELKLQSSVLPAFELLRLNVGVFCHSVE